MKRQIHILAFFMQTLICQASKLEFFSIDTNIQINMQLYILVGSMQKSIYHTNYILENELLLCLTMDT